MQPHNGRRRGLTLLEVMIALLVTGLVVVSARGIAEQLSISARANVALIDTRLATVSREGELRRGFLLARESSDSALAFDGSLDRITWSTMCTVPRGWDETCRCNVRVAQQQDGHAFVRQCDTDGVDETLLTDSVGFAILYLADPTNGGKWYRQWGRSVSTPFAIGVVRFGVRDTLIVRVGSRG
jgi:prepilin-type N-terminal cleavage/methylation domain-containing protein